MLSIELTRLFNWATLPTIDAEELFDEPEINEVMRWANNQPLPEQEELLRALPKRLPALDPTKASVVLVLAGGLVENGASPHVLIAAGIAHLARLRALLAEGLALPPAAWRFAIIGLMAMLCRSAEGRALFKQQTELLAWLEEEEETSSHFFYLLRIAEVSDEEVLWVVFPDYGTGLELSALQVNNTFHLLTLMQPLMLSQAAALRLRSQPKPTDPAILRYALHDSLTPPEASDYNRFEWLNALAYQGGSLDRLASAWGEAPVSSLPRVLERVVLLATENENRLVRSWDATYLSALHSANRPEVTIRRLLSPEEVSSLLQAIHPPVATPVAESPAKRSL
ncbi:hypothetical protein [Hymenobacter psoromatis]|uniref:hypothetical protein n=1 Tax=Hymenobacter psoromatis TaxID=1484116 RepID=UPI001CC159CE|nr:hypothetical protein [Hymenobacter psoromatis]